MIFIFIFIIAYIFLLPITIIAFLWQILDKVSEKPINETITKKQNRQHPSIKKSNYNNAFGGRKAYDIYKNKDGLYEPVTPSRGMKIEKKEE